MAVPHFMNVRTGKELMEPVWTNLFEVTLDFPQQLINRYNLNAEEKNDLRLVTENIVKINYGNTVKDLSPVKQIYKYSSRVFIGMPGETHTTLDMDIQVNVNNKMAVTVWNLLRAWYDLGWNSQTGTAFNKRNMIGNVNVIQHDKEGNTIRQLRFVNFQITKWTGGYDSLDWSGTTSIAKGTLNGVCDFWYDLYVDSVNSGG